MVCYVLPTLAAAMIYAHRKKDGRTDDEGRQLNLLLSGGAVFGLVDHAWNGQLFWSPNFGSDLMLGVLITAAIYAVWFVMMVAKQSAKAPSKSAAVA